MIPGAVIGNVDALSHGLPLQRLLQFMQKYGIHQLRRVDQLTMEHAVEQLAFGEWITFELSVHVAILSGEQMGEPAAPRIRQFSRESQRLTGDRVQDGQGSCM